MFYDLVCRRRSNGQHFAFDRLASIAQGNKNMNDLKFMPSQAGASVHLDKMNQAIRTQTKFSWIFLLLSLIACWPALVTTAHAERSVSLAWSPSPDPNVAGYYVYSTEENSSTATRISAGANTQATVTGLKEGLQYSFTVTAYNATGVESAPSNEAFWRVPVPLNLLSSLPPAYFQRLRFPLAPGHWYELQASTDLKNWTTIWQSGTATTYSWTEVNDTKSGSYKSRFYRLQVH